MQKLDQNVFTVKPPFSPAAKPDLIVFFYSIPSLAFHNGWFEIKNYPIGELLVDASGYKNSSLTSVIHENAT